MRSETIPPLPYSSLPPLNSPSTASIAGRPLHAMVVPFPIACFVGTLVTDIVYWRTADMMWETFSVWLLTIGLVISFFAVVFGLIDFFGSRNIRSLPGAWLHGLGNGVALVLAIINAFVHSRDGWTAVVPQGLILSALTVIILAFTGWLGWGMIHRNRVGVEDARF